MAVLVDVSEVHVTLFCSENAKTEEQNRHQTVKHRESLKSVIAKLSKFADHCNLVGSYIFSKTSFKINAITYYDILYESSDIDVAFSA
jgi:hypothetical protein